MISSAALKQALGETNLILIRIREQTLLHHQKWPNARVLYNEDILEVKKGILDASKRLNGRSSLIRSLVNLLVGDKLEDKIWLLRLKAESILAELLEGQIFVAADFER